MKTWTLILALSFTMMGCQVSCSTIEKDDWLGGIGADENGTYDDD